MSCAGNFTNSEDEENCWETSEGIGSSPVSYACKKQSLCYELDCVPNPQNPEKCYVYFPNIINYQGASSKCEELGGTLPTIQSLEDYDYIDSITSGLSWTSLQQKSRNNKALQCKGNEVFTRKVISASKV